jgi:hypothetical protein
MTNFDDIAYRAKDADVYGARLEKRAVYFGGHLWS